MQIEQLTEIQKTVKADQEKQKKMIEEDLKRFKELGAKYIQVTEDSITQATASVYDAMARNADRRMALGIDVNFQA